jgi:uncharacterized sulfatase
MDVTPNLDKMAKEGVLFENTYTNQPVCGPARAIIQTGVYAEALKCYRNGIALPKDQKTIADYFNEAGYETAYVGKWHLASNMNRSNIDIGARVDYRKSPVPPGRRGGYKDFWIASDTLEFTSHSEGGYMFDAEMKKRKFNRYRVDATTDFAFEYLKNRKGDKPFFLMISYIEPHHQNDRNRYEGPPGSKEKFKDFPIPGDLAGTKGDWRRSYPDYLGCCNSLDENLGRLRDELENQGIADNTVIMYTSDHGSHFRTRNSEYKRSCHDGCTRIPLVISGPGFEGGKRITEQACTIDIAPTLLGIAGINKPRYMKGYDLGKLISGSTEFKRKGVYIQISEDHVGRAVATPSWKYEVIDRKASGTRDPSGSEYTEAYLYDLENDPFERNNLINKESYAEIRGELRRLLHELMAEAGEENTKILTPDK